MNEENRPNLNAVGLLTDILQAIDKRRRGKAGGAPMAELMGLVSEDVKKFVELIDSLLDDRFGDSHDIVIRNPADSEMLFMVAATNKFFEDAMNSIVAPATRAWTDYKVQKVEQIIVKPGDIEENEARFTVVLHAKRRNT
jgi:hypothetical protein